MCKILIKLFNSLLYILDYTDMSTSTISQQKILCLSFLMFQKSEGVLFIPFCTFLYFLFISDYTDMSTSNISQRQILSFHAPFHLVYYCLQTLAGKVEKLEIQGKQAFRVFEVITVIQDKGNILIEVRIDTI